MEYQEDKTPQPERTPEIIKFELDNIINQLREQRNQLLKESDIYMLPDYPISPENLEKVKIYRQQLRDYMSQINGLVSIPKMPQFPFPNLITK